MGGRLRVDNTARLPTRSPVGRLFGRIRLPARYVRRALALLCILFASPHAADASEVARLAGAVSAIGYEVPAARTLRAACDEDVLCAARFLKDLIGDEARLLPVESDAARRTAWTDRPPPILEHTSDGDAATLVLARFDARAVAAALKPSPPRHLTIDLRDIGEPEDLDGMRRVAGLFIGRHDRAFRIDYVTGRIVDWQVPASAERFRPATLTVLIGPDTAGAAEIFAVLMKKYGRAEILGAPSAGAYYLRRIVPVTHGWVLSLPRGRMSVPGVHLTGGVSPDRPL